MAENFIYLRRIAFYFCFERRSVEQWPKNYDNDHNKTGDYDTAEMTMSAIDKKNSFTGEEKQSDVPLRVAVVGVQSVETEHQTDNSPTK